MAKKNTPPATEKKLRGRPRKFSTPNDLWDAFQRYRQWVKDNPLKVHDYRGKDVDEVYIKKERPLSLEGFSNFCWELKIHSYIDDYFHNKNGAYESFSSICTRIKAIIRENQIAGGMAGIFNPSITQRLNNLVEKSEAKVETTQVKQVFKIGDQIISFD